MDYVDKSSANMNIEDKRTDLKREEINSDTQVEPSREHNSLNNTEGNAAGMDIDPENEITGIKLLFIHTGICLCTFLVGLVSSGFEDSGKTA